MSRDRHDCRYQLPAERSPHHRCLIFYGHALHNVRDGLIGSCNDWKPVLNTDEELGAATDAEKVRG